MKGKKKMSDFSEFIKVSHRVTRKYSKAVEILEEIGEDLREMGLPGLAVLPEDSITNLNMMLDKMIDHEVDRRNLSETTET